MGGAVLIAAVKYVCVSGGCGGVGGCDCGYGCDCVGGWVGMGVNCVGEEVCGWYSFNCCCKVCMCVSGVGFAAVIVWVGVFDFVGGCGCDFVVEEGSVWVVQS